MKLIKRLGVLLLVLIVVIAVGVLGAYLYVDSIAKAAIEKGGTYALGVPTTLGDADVGLRSGDIGLENLAVANPQGYKSASFLTMEQGGVQVSLGTLRKDIVELPRLSLSDIQINLEKEQGKANYQVIMDNLKKFESQDPQQQPKEAGTKKFVIHRVDISDVKVHVDLIPVGGELTQVDIALDRVSLENVGTAGKGVPLPELASIIVKALMSAIADKGGDILPADLLGDIRGQLAQLQNLDELGVRLTADLREQAEKAIEDARKDVEKAIDETTKDVEKKVEEGLKGLIPGGKK